MTIDLTHNRNSNTYLIETRHGLISPCIGCRKFEPILLRGEDYFKYFMQNACIEDAFPYLSRDEREKSSFLESIQLAGTSCSKEIVTNESH
jgi:hypothetical protein